MGEFSIQDREDVVRDKIIEIHYTRNLFRLLKNCIFCVFVQSFLLCPNVRKRIVGNCNEISQLKLSLSANAAEILPFFCEEMQEVWRIKLDGSQKSGGIDQKSLLVENSWI